MSEEVNKTTVKEVDIDEINDILDIGGEIMLPNETQEKKLNVFSNTAPDMTFLDKTDEDEPQPQEEEEEPSTEELKAEEEEETPPAKESDKAEDVIKQPGDEEELEDEPKNKGGRPPAFVSAMKKLIDQEIILPFDDGKKLEEYTAEDIEELLLANFEETKTKLAEQLPQHFFATMPVEMQQAYNYIAKGGQDLKGLFRAMSQAHEVRDIDIESESGQIHAVRSYLQATGYGTTDEIEDEIQSLIDRGDLEKKANQFKPKLDNMQQQLINSRLEQQQMEAAKRHEQSQMYMENVYDVLKEGDLNGLKLDNRVQNYLYAGLVQPNYVSQSGRQTNLLGHLLEKYQFIEPDHGLIAEALWLLSDPEGYRKEVKEIGEKDSTAKTVRKLKGAQSNMSNSSYSEEEEPEKAPRKRPAISRPKRNFFARD